MQAMFGTVTMTHGDVDVFAGEIHMMHVGRDAQVDAGMCLGKAAKAMCQPFGSEIWRCADGQNARVLPLLQAVCSGGDTIQSIAHYL